ncbi:MAG: mucoidy inhibitor MuiA family protein [Candidatus Caldatribacteriota bacterium]|nr:mucoidy inhibitor MuiA family protein [Candidatus Caldatribacteriota bacterium]
MNKITRIIFFSVLALLVSFSSFSAFAASTEIEVKSEIDWVCVYPDSALIDRVAHLELERGAYKIILPNIVSEVDENSLRVSVLGEASIRLFGAQIKKEYLGEIPSERISQLKEEIQKLEDQIKEIQSQKALLTEKKKFLDSITLFSGGQIPQDLITKMPTTSDLKNILNFLDVELEEYYSQVLNCEIKIRDLKNRVNVLKRELSQISGAQKKLKRSIVAELEVLKSGTADLHVSYLVNGAAWNPIYDARADFEKSEVELVSYGVIRQITGEDWLDINCSLSTAKPRIGGRMPYVSPWTLKPYEPHVATDRMMEAPASAYQKQAFKTGEEITGEGIISEVKYATAEEKGIAVSYQLPYKITVKADKSENKFPISSQKLSAEFEYSTYPRVSPFAYLGSRVVNSETLQLLAGRVNIFLEGDFVGTSRIDNIAPGEEFDLYLGVDENVKVKRELLEKKVDKTLIAGILSRTKKTTFKYKLTVENYKSKKIKIKLFEAIPVSEDDRIKIKRNEVSLEPEIKDWEDRKGIWLWELELEPQQKQEITYNFTVEHPRDMVVKGL